MTTTVPTPTGTSQESLTQVLEPVRQGLLDDAKAEADRIVSAATRDAEEVFATATAEADAAVDRASHRAEVSAQTHADQVLARVRNDGQRLVLSAQEGLRQQLIDEVHTAARGLVEHPRYPALLDHLESQARGQLGDDVLIDRDPEGGLVAVAGSRRVDYRLSALASRALEALADEVAELWT